MAKAKEDAVANSQQMLEEDAKKFEDYLQVCETHRVFAQPQPLLFWFRGWCEKHNLRWMFGLHMERVKMGYSCACTSPQKHTLIA